MLRIKRLTIFAILFLFMVHAAYAMKPYVTIQNLKLTANATDIVVTGTIVAGNLNTPIPDSDYVVVVAEIPTSSVYRYPTLYDHFNNLEDCKAAGNRCLTESELKGVNVVSIELFSATIRPPHVWQRYGINSWRQSAPNVVRVSFSGYIPIKYASKNARLHAILKHVTGGPYALWPKVRFYHWVKYVRLPSYGYAYGPAAVGVSDVYRLKKELNKCRKRIRKLEDELWRCRLKLHGCGLGGKFEYETDRPGLDYKHFKIYSTDPELCKVACDRDPKCRAWTFKKKSSSSGVCWLKYGVPAPVRNPACVSGVKKVITHAFPAKYLGCFRDRGNPAGLDGRDLNGYMFESKHGMTPALCISVCREKGFAYAGVQYSYQCFCGNSYGKYGRADNCDMRCSGNSHKICGGSWANSVYSTGISASSAGYASSYGLNKRVTFYGKRVRSSIGGSATVEGNTLVVKYRARVVSYNTNAPSFCIWKENASSPFACSGFRGLVLRPGKYWLVPGLRSGQYSSWVKVKVVCRACYIE